MWRTWIRKAKIGAVVLALTPVFLYLFPSLRWVPKGQFLALKHKMHIGTALSCANCNAGYSYPQTTLPNSGTTLEKIREIDHSSRDVFERFERLEKEALQNPNEKFFVAAAARQGVSLLKISGGPDAYGGKHPSIAKNDKAKSYAKRLIRLCKIGLEKEPKNGVYYLGIAAAYQSLELKTERDSALRMAAKCIVFDDHSFLESQERLKVMDSDYGYRGTYSSWVDSNSSNGGFFGIGLRFLATDLIMLKEADLDLRQLLAELAVRYAAASNWELDFRTASTIFFRAVLNLEKLPYNISNFEKLNGVRLFAKELDAANISKSQLNWQKTANQFISINERFPEDPYDGTWDDVYSSVACVTIFLAALLLLALSKLFSFILFPKINPMAWPTLGGAIVALAFLLSDNDFFESNGSAMCLYLITFAVSLVPSISKFAIWIGLAGSAVIFLAILPRIYEDSGGYSLLFFTVLAIRYLWTQKFKKVRTFNLLPAIFTSFTIFLLGAGIENPLLEAFLLTMFSVILLGIICSCWQDVQLRDSYKMISRTWPFVLIAWGVLYLIFVIPIYVGDRELAEYDAKSNAVAAEIRSELSVLLKN